MSNVRALASTRVFVIHRRVAYVAILRSGCPSFGSQRKVEPPAGKDSCFRHEPRARHRRSGTWLPFAADKKPGTRTVRIQDGERLGQNRRIEHNAFCAAPRTECGLKQTQLEARIRVQMQERELSTAVPARLSSEERSNPSIEGTLSGLRPPSATHVKR
jgi:hypothetical protein